jgi:hypothetical protein
VHSKEGQGRKLEDRIIGNISLLFILHPLVDPRVAFYENMGISDGNPL